VEVWLQIVRLGIGDLRQDPFRVTDRVELVEPTLREVEVGHDAVTLLTLIPDEGVPGRGEELTVPVDCVPSARAMLERVPTGALIVADPSFRHRGLPPLPAFGGLPLALLNA
jgi:hypothetical protein